MGNTSKGAAEKGSKKLIQDFVNKQSDNLNSALGLSEITWISPIKEEFREYKLNEKYITGKKVSDFLGITDLFPSDIIWWPKNGPQWDALGYNDGNIILVEAKANTDELRSKCKATKDISIGIIKETIRKLFNNNEYLEKYYQMINRYVFINKINECLGKKKNAMLVFLYFTNDPNAKGQGKHFTKEKSEILKDHIKKIEDAILPQHENVKKNVKHMLIELDGQGYKELSIVSSSNLLPREKNN